MMEQPKPGRTRRLIEEWLPIAGIGIESVRERTPMTPFPAPNRLHVWWARRPLVASRAAILASLLPADADRAKFLHLASFGPALQVFSESWPLRRGRAIQKPRELVLFPDEALKLARVVGLDFDREVKNQVCEVKSSDLILWDSLTRKRKNKLGPVGVA